MCIEWQWIQKRCVLKPFATNWNVCNNKTLITFVFQQGQLKLWKGGYQNSFHQLQMFLSIHFNQICLLTGPSEIIAKGSAPVWWKPKLHLPTILNEATSWFLSRRLRMWRPTYSWQCPYNTPDLKDDHLLKQTTSFQESTKEALKLQVGLWHQQLQLTLIIGVYRKALHTLLSTYYENVLDMTRASGVMQTRPLALHRMPQKPPADRAATPGIPCRRPPRRRPQRPRSTT